MYNVWEELKELDSLVVSISKKCEICSTLNSESTRYKLLKNDILQNIWNVRKLVANAHKEGFVTIQAKTSLDTALDEFTKVLL